MNKPQIILLFGRICSGKTSFKATSSYRIVVSNIVRSLVQSADRDKLQQTMHLDERIAEEIVSCLDALTTAISKNLIQEKVIIVDGIRQPSIVDKVLQWYPESELLWMDAPTATRKRRYEARHADKDIEPFDVADNKPIELECQEIYSIFKDKLNIINNH